MSQAGRPAPAPGVRRASKQGPCREAGQGIKGDREEVGCGGCERPSRARGWGGPGPRPQRPTSGCRECPAVPGDPGVGR